MSTSAGTIEMNMAWRLFKFKLHYLESDYIFQYWSHDGLAIWRLKFRLNGSERLFASDWHIFSLDSSGGTLWWIFALTLLPNIAFSHFSFCSNSCSRGYRTFWTLLSESSPRQLQPCHLGDCLHGAHLHWYPRKRARLPGSGPPAQDAHLAQSLHHQPCHFGSTTLLLHNSIFAHWNFYQIMAIR